MQVRVQADCNGTEYTARYVVGDRDQGCLLPACTARVNNNLGSRDVTGSRGLSCDIIVMVTVRVVVKWSVSGYP